MHTDDTQLDDLLDGLVAEYSDLVEAGQRPSHGEFLARVPARARPGLERCLKVMDAGRDAVGQALLAPGQQLGRFRIQRELGRGGMAVVYLADDPELRRTVALKVLRPGLALEPGHVARFQREGQAMARLSHPGVAQVFEVGTDAGVHWIAMEYVAGPSLASVVAALHGGGAPTAELLARLTGDARLAELGSLDAACAALLLSPAEGLAAAHGAGLVHRDVKPSNILLHPGGRAVVADFGLARAEGDPGLSLTGEPIGTPHYMAPEQADAAAAAVDVRADVYGMGVVLFELVSGHRPFEGDTVLEVLDAIRYEASRPLRSVATHAGRDAEAVVERALQRDKERRYQDVDALRAELERLAAGERTHARRDAGGPLRRTLSGIGAVFAGQAPEYRSAAAFLGMPLVHVVGAPVRRPFGQRRPRPRVARGWLALGPVATGGLCIGGMCAGLLSMGGMAAGLLAASGGMAMGGLSAGGVSVGGRAFGGLAVGDVAVGGMAVGRGAIGGMTVGRYVVHGGDGQGTHSAIYDHPELSDPAVWDFFAAEPEPLRSIYLGMFGPGFAAAREEQRR